MTILFLIASLWLGLSIPLSPVLPTTPTTDTTIDGGIESFACDTTTGFAFQYPVPAGWKVLTASQPVPERGAVRHCSMLWQHEFKKFTVAPLVAVVAIPGPVDITTLAKSETVLTSPQGVTYIHNPDTHSTTFYGPAQSVTVDTPNISVTGVQADFETMLVETFQWTE